MKDVKVNKNEGLEPPRQGDLRPRYAGFVTEMLKGDDAAATSVREEWDDILQRHDLDAVADGIVFIPLVSVKIEVLRHRRVCAMASRVPHAGRRRRAPRLVMRTASATARSSALTGARFEGSEGGVRQLVSREVVRRPLPEMFSGVHIWVTRR